MLMEKQKIRTDEKNLRIGQHSQRCSQREALKGLGRWRAKVWTLQENKEKFLNVASDDREFDAIMKNPDAKWRPRVNQRCLP